MPSSVHTETLLCNAGGKSLHNYFAVDSTRAGKRPALALFPEWWGHNDYLRRRARELAQLGYAALAVDIYGDGREAADSAEAGQLMNGLFADMASTSARIRASIAQLAAHPLVDPARVGALGYCLGGALALHAARLGLPLRGVASFHGALSRTHETAPGVIQAAVLVCHGEADSLVPADDVTNFRKEMADLGVDLEFHSYPGAKHGFTNPEATENGKKYNLPLAYDEKTDRESWDDMKTFWTRVLGPA
jgi:dienelactone hydrolase